MMVMVSILLEDKNYVHVFAILEYDESNLPLSNNVVITDNDILNFNKDNQDLLVPESISSKEENIKPLTSYRNFCLQSNHVE